MPQVGNKHFAYTPAGTAAAVKEGKKKGVKVKNITKDTYASQRANAAQTMT